MASWSACALEGDASCFPVVVEKGVRVSPSDAPTPDQRFPRSCRLTARRQFQLVYERGRRAASASFVLFGQPNDLGHCRLGLTVTRKVGNAVERNKIKRRMREVFRRHRAQLAPAMDLVLNARAAALTGPTEALEREFLQTFARIAKRRNTP